jgi:DNA polymerase-1
VARRVYADTHRGCEKSVLSEKSPPPAEAPGTFPRLLADPHADRAAHEQVDHHQLAVAPADHQAAHEQDDHGRPAHAEADHLRGEQLHHAVDQQQLPVTYHYVADAAGLAAVLAALAAAEVVALDVETSGLSPHTDRVRLLSLATGPDRPVFLVDCFAVDPASVLGALAGKELVGHNLSFDLAFLAGLGFEPGRVCCTMLLSQLLDGPRQPKGFHTLRQVAARELGRELPKDLQASDWTAAELSAGQLEYAARDVAVLLPLYDRLMARVRDAGMAGVAALEFRCLPALVWLSTSGVGFDRARWEALAAEAGRQAGRLGRRLAEQAGPGVNWNSPVQVKRTFAAAGIDLPDTTDDTLAGIDHPLAWALREYRTASKLATTYGPDWIKGAYHQGRLYAGWRQVGCVTGRMSAAGPNLQNLPGDVRYRACFKAPEGRVLIRADYSQIELRVVARITNDRRMLDAYANGEDLHTLTARQLTGKDEVTDQERRVAKPINFGVIYGMSPAALRRKARAEYGLNLTPQDAERYRSSFFRSYRGVGAWHGRLRNESAPEVRTLAGRRCRLPEKHFYGTKANYQTQGTAGDGLKAALALLWERRAGCPGSPRLVLAVHDEIVIEADADQAGAAGDWLRQAMIDGMAPLIDPVPVEVEVKTGRTWAGDAEVPEPEPAPDVPEDVGGMPEPSVIVPAPAPAAVARQPAVPPAARVPAVPRNVEDRLAACDDTDDDGDDTDDDGDDGDTCPAETPEPVAFPGGVHKPLRWRVNGCGGSGV